MGKGVAASEVLAFATEFGRFSAVEENAHQIFWIRYDPLLHDMIGAFESGKQWRIRIRFL